MQYCTECRGGLSYNATMASPCRTIMLVLLLGNVAWASNNTHGCKLNTPQDVQDQMEAKGKPLQVNITIMVSRVRDVPDSGGSFGVDFM